MKKNPLVAPVVKWVGGKRQLLSDIMKLIPHEFSTYYEPFLGGGAILFNLQPTYAIVNDINEELINMYLVIKNDVHKLIEDLKKHRNEASYFYKLRELDRNKIEYRKLSDVERASRVIYLNKTCYNGLFRVNQRGEFNAPFGKYKNPNIVNEKRLLAVSDYLNKANVQFKCGDFEDIFQSIEKGTFVYFDPPYDPLTCSANFTGYVSGGFNRDEQIRLKKLCDRLTQKEVRFLLSNSATDFILELYKDYKISFVKANRVLNCDFNKRGSVKEVLVRNY